MKVLVPLYLAQDDVADVQLVWIVDGVNCAELSGLNLADHRVASGTKLNAFALL